MCVGSSLTVDQDRSRQSAPVDDLAATALAVWLLTVLVY